jgi:hypothetical protein
MKRNRKGFAVLALAALLLATLPAQSPPGTATLVSARDLSVSQVATTSPLTLHDFLGKKGLNLDVRAFGGFNLSEGLRPGAGLAVSFRKDLSRELFADLGLFGRAQQDRKLDGGLFVSLGWRL